MSTLSKIIDDFCKYNSGFTKRCEKFLVPFLLLQYFGPLLFWFFIFLIYYDTAEAPLLVDVTVYAIILFFTLISGNDMGLGTGEECAALLDAAIHKIPVSFCAKAAVFILLPILVSMVIKIIYKRLFNGTSKLYIFTRYGDPLYRELMRLADTEKLTDMIDDMCWEYLETGKEEKVVSEIHTGSRNESENLQQEMEKVEAVESRRNKGRFREAVHLLNAAPPFKYKSGRQLELYRAFLDRLEKVVKFPEEKKLGIISWIL